MRRFHPQFSRSIAKNQFSSARFTRSSFPRCRARADCTRVRDEEVLKRRMEKGATDGVRKKAKRFVSRLLSSLSLFLSLLIYMCMIIILNEPQNYNSYTKRILLKYLKI